MNKRFLGGVVTAVFLLLACQLSSLPVALPADESAGVLPDFPTPQPPGFSPANPLPPGQPIQMGNWTVEVRQFLRGEKAREALAAANRFNEPPPDGEEYILIQFYVRNNAPQGEDSWISLAVTGSRRIRYYSFDANVVTPQPYLESDLPGGEEMEGWLAYRVGQGETDLLLVVDELLDGESDIIYAALAENAALTLPAAELAGIQANDAGRSLDAPAAYGEMVTTADWQIKVTDVVQGEAAWEMVQAANQFNDPPPDGLMYVALKIWARYIGLDEAGRKIDYFTFALTDEQGETWERVSVVRPTPALNHHFYPGGEAEGWVVLPAAADGRTLILVFTPLYATEPRYFSLGYGR